MADIITELTARIEDYRSTNKNPCKNYATQAAAEKATAKMAQAAATYFDKQGREDAPSADYVVFYVEAWVAGWAALTCPSSCAAATRRADTWASAKTSSPTNNRAGAPLRRCHCGYLENTMNAFEVIQLARKHADNGAPMQSSAQLCLQDAEALQAQGKCVEARNRAVKSLQYSVGVFHPDYQATDPRRS